MDFLSATLFDPARHIGIHSAGGDIGEVAYRHRRNACRDLGLDLPDLVLDKGIDPCKGSGKINARCCQRGLHPANGVAKFIGHGVGHLYPPSCDLPDQHPMMPWTGRHRQVC